MLMTETFPGDSNLFVLGVAWSLIVFKASQVILMQIKVKSSTLGHAGTSFTKFFTIANFQR